MGSELRIVRRSLMVKRTGSPSVIAQTKSWIKASHTAEPTNQDS
ncbi:MAG: hypothetical protein ACJ70S_01040 [Nitrososphaera sp.]